MTKAELVRKELRLIVRELGLLHYNCLNSGLTLAQAHLLSYLKQNGETPFHELVLQLGIDKASLSRMLTNLEAKAFIQVETSPLDKRMKLIRLLSVGREAIIKGDDEATAFMNQILDLGNEAASDTITKSFKEFRMLALKKNLINDKSRIKLEKVPANYQEEAISLATEVFTSEQQIPENVIPLKEGVEQMWWCARVGEDIIGVAAAWAEHKQWHWGRFAVDSRLRGLGIGKKLAIFSLHELFQLDVEKVFIEARDVTVKMLEQLGCRIEGTPTDFYGEPVTPITIQKSDFISCMSVSNGNQKGWIDKTQA